MLFRSPLHVRVDVDEHEAWRVKSNSPAQAFVRGNRDINTALQFVRFEPYVIPKKSLTGESSERVDTRVLQVIYSFDPGNLPVYIGQQMDVFIEADPYIPSTTQSNANAPNFSSSASTHTSTPTSAGNSAEKPAGGQQ